MTAFGWLVHAEWTKFRTVRGWVIGLLIAVLATIGIGLLSNSSCSSNGGACPAPPLGPGGEAVQDDFYFVHQPLAGNGTITARLTSLAGKYWSTGRVAAGQGGANADANMTPGLRPWSKAGLIIKASTAQGSAYAAMLVTGGHGVRMQWNYVNDTAGLPGGVSGASPRWLRLVRSGDTITGYDSLDGTRWTRVGTATLPGLAVSVEAGMFAGSPPYSVTLSSGIGGSTGSVTPTQATGVFDNVSLSWAAARWTGSGTGGARSDETGTGNFGTTGSGYTVTGSGDIAPLVANTDAGGGIGIKDALVGTFAGLIGVAVIAAMFITAEYRRGLIRVTLAASPNRTRALAAKSVVLAAVALLAGIVATAIAIPLATSRLRANGNVVLPVPVLTEVRVVAGTGLMLAVAAIFALAIGTVIRRSAVAVATVIVAVFIPYLLATVPGLLPGGAQGWLLRLTPAAAFSVQQAYPQYASVDVPYRPVDGYYPLAPWAGFAVLCAWAAAALLLAGYLLRRRDV